VGARAAAGAAAGELLARADVVVVGSGYTGLHTALQTARGGRHTVVLDAEDAGWGWVASAEVVEIPASAGV